MAWEKGVSGNPKGRPKKGRALTELLEKMGSKRIEADGKKAARRAVFAERLWEGVTTGQITFEGGAKLVLEPSEYISLAKLLLGQIDGPPPTGVDVTSDGEAVQRISVVEIVRHAD